VLEEIQEARSPGDELGDRQPGVVAGQGVGESGGLVHGLENPPGRVILVRCPVSFIVHLGQAVLGVVFVGLRKALLKRGLPARLYCDNGVIYTSRQFSRIVAELGIHHILAKPYAPEGKGKIERFWRTVDSSFLPELRARPAKTLEELNAPFGAWLEQGYHHWANRETGETPAARFARGMADIRLPDPTRLTEVFLWQECRRVDKTGQVPLQGNRYEVDPRLARRRV